MKIKTFGLLVLLLLVMLALMPVSAQGRVCNPFTTTPDTGMLPVGQVVTFSHFEGAPAPVTRTGSIVAYYILSCWPGYPVIGLDPQAYVVDYGSADGSRIVLNRTALNTQ